jgi:PAS domain S-box-containing protein
MKERLNRLSVRRKIILLVFVVAVLSLFFGFLLASYYQIRSLRSNYAQAMRVNALLLADAAATHLSSLDKESLQILLDRTRRFLDLEALYVFDTGGNLFCASPLQSYVSEPSGWRTEYSEYADGALHVIQPIKPQHNVIGSIYMRASIRNVNHAILMNLVIQWSFFLISILLALWLSYRFQRFVSAPILDLAVKTSHIPESIVFSREIDPHADEIGSLYSAFKKMLRKIERREEQRDRAEEAFSESEKRYRNLVESNPDAIFLQNEEGIVYLNQAGFRMLALHAESDWKGKKIQSFFKTPFPGPRVGEGVFEAEILSLDGRKIDADVILIETTHERIPALQGVIRDVTEAKQLRESAQKLKQLAAIGELSAQVAHEIRNSIGSLQLNLRYFSDHQESFELRERTIRGMEAAIERMEQSVIGILNFARPNPPVRNLTPLALVLDSSLKAEEAELKLRGIEVIRSYSNALPQVRIDAYQIQQVFLNLIRNSRQAMSSGGSLSVSADVRNGVVEIRIADTGEGIPEENLEKIFQPFFTTKPDGTGLGLAVVARIVEMHHAQIMVDENTKSGAAFLIRFPLDKEP